MSGGTLRALSAEEIAILRRVQDDLPDSATPFDDIGRPLGVPGSAVAALLRELAAQGAIRRFGASLRHQRAGFTANAMVAWRVAPDEAERAGGIMAGHEAVSHCYQRRPAPDWPYALYTMIHGRSPQECLETVAALSRATGAAEHVVLFSVEELKKTSMRYFAAG